ncbi:hypothetical protein M569_04352, partial [Genlisea aurea]
KKISPFRLSSLIRLQKDPLLAFELFIDPNPNETSRRSKPFRHSLLSYDRIITKLGRAKLFPQLETVVRKLKDDRRVAPEEILFCNVIKHYGRGGLPEEAVRTFEEIPAFRCRRTIRSVNTLLNSLLVCGEFGVAKEEAIAWVERYATPDSCTYNILMNACFLRSDFVGAFKVFDEMRDRGLNPSVVTFGILINGLCRNSQLKTALRLKTRMESAEFNITPNAPIYVALIKGLCKANDFDRAVELKDEMVSKKLASDPAVYSTLISAAFKLNRRNEVPGLLEEMKHNGCKPDTVTYNAIIHGHCESNEFDSAFRALSRMEQGGGECKPDVITYNVILAGLCRQGRLEDAKDLLNDMPRLGCRPDVVSYATMFEGLCDAKEFREAAEVLEEMVFKGYIPFSSRLCRNVDGFLSG